MRVSDGSKFRKVGTDGRSLELGTYWRLATMTLEGNCSLELLLWVDNLLLPRHFLQVRHCKFDLRMTHIFVVWEWKWDGVHIKICQSVWVEVNIIKANVPYGTVLTRHSQVVRMNSNRNIEHNKFGIILTSKETAVRLPRYQWPEVSKGRVTVRL